MNVSKKKAYGGRSKEQQAAIERRWKGVPVRDADSDLLIFVSEDDVREATPGDPESCAASLACKRLYGSTGVEFFHKAAYVDLPDPDDHNRRVVMRFILPKRTSEMIETLDGGGTPSPGGYKLKAPTVSQGLEAQRMASQRARRTRRAATMRGEIYVPNRKFSKPSKKISVSGYVRSGTGMVQMTMINSE